MSTPRRCPRCGRENDPGAAFCLDCGQALAAPRPAAPAGAACASCGAPLQPGHRFCGACGKPVATVSPRTPRQAAAGPEAPALTPVPFTLPTVPAVPARGAGRIRLVLVRSDGKPGPVFTTDQDEVVCGRSEGELRLADDAAVSPRHARFTLAGGVLRVEDLGSVNGTFLRLKGPRRIAVGDELRLGRQLLRLEPLPRPPAPDASGVRAWGTKDAGCRLRLSQLLEGGGLGEIFPLREGDNVVGREAGDLTFPADRYVSARHARIEVKAGEVTIADAGSSNGTYLKLAGSAELAKGDQLLVGAQLIRVE